MSDITLIPHYSVAPYGVTFFSLPDNNYSFKLNKNSLQNLKDNTNYYGDLSENAQKRLRKKINYMLYITEQKDLKGAILKSKSTNYTIEKEKGLRYQNSINYKLTFITLTLPSKQIHTDNVIKSKCLNHFLVELRKLKKNSLYIWKAEKQENGNIHFHILFNAYVKWQLIRSIWNRIINKLGYVDTYSQNMQAYFSNGFKISNNPLDKRTYETQLKSYNTGKKCNWNNPNSTDIHALYKVKHLGAYISKYISKGVTKTKRTVEISTLLENRKLLINTIISINKDAIPLANSFENKNHLLNEIKAIKTEITIIEDKLKVLREKGIIGRIWGCSSKLSKISNFSDIGNESAIEEIDIIKKIYENAIINEIGKQQIITLIFDINKTPILKAQLNQHIENCIGIN